jgi:membrane protein
MRGPLKGLKILYKVSDMEIIRNFVVKVIHFVTIGIWKIRLSDLSGKKSALIKTLRVFLLAIRGFGEDKCTLRASSLTFYTLISIVPILAMALAIAKGFGLRHLLEKELIMKFQGQEEVITWIINFSGSFLESIKGGVLAGVGTIVLLWAVINVLSQIELSFNEIWKIRKSRSLWRKLSDYFFVMFLFPIFIIMSGSITLLVKTQFTLITEKIALIGFISPFIFFLLNLSPVVLNWLVFSFIYMLMTNTKVKFKPGLLAGIIAGTIFSLTQWAYITFQIGVSKYNAIYGSFAALPLFMVWLQVSWLIILFGAELAFAYQNVETYELEPDSQLISSYFKRLLTLQVAHLLIKKFADGESPLSSYEITHVLEIPLGLVNQILYELVESGILSEIQTDNYKESAFQPARDISTLTVAHVIEALENRGIHDIPVVRDASLMMLSESLKSFQETIQHSPANRLMKDI